jgi:hypothetical protein
LSNENYKKSKLLNANDYKEKQKFLINMKKGGSSRFASLQVSGA